MEARRKGKKCYAISAFCVHNSNGLHKLPAAFAEAVNFLRDKWREQLPIRTPCILITRWGLPLLRHRIESFFERNRKSGARCANPSALYKQLVLEKRAAHANASTLELVRQ
jgi:hypothetical protein